MKDSWQLKPIAAKREHHLAPATVAVTAQALSEVKAEHEQQLLAFQTAVERAR